MQYKNGKEVFPPSLLKEVQKHIQGELIYIPKQNNQRAGWGEVNGSRRLLARRNEEIYQLYSDGWSFEKLEQKYNLSIESIRKIIYKTRGECNERRAPLRKTGQKPPGPFLFSVCLIFCTLSLVLLYNTQGTFLLHIFHMKT
ncbi:MAG TPA: CD3324 family protein [Bacillus sp. (in: firmicutes)]|nr:CD3324 family protein [Bacillus sp. (in: firmicutes)]